MKRKLLSLLSVASFFLMKAQNTDYNKDFKFLEYDIEKLQKGYQNKEYKISEVVNINIDKTRKLIGQDEQLISDVKKVVEVVKTGNLSIKVNANTDNESLEELKIIFNEMLKVISEKDFMNLVKSISTDEINQYKISGIINDFTKNNDMIYNHIIKEDNYITCKYLNSLGFYWPDLNYDYFKKLIINFFIMV